MLKDKNKTNLFLRDNDNSYLKVLIIVIVLVAFVVLALAMKKPKSIPNKVLPEKDNLVELFDNIKDNYTLDIEKNVNDIKSNIIYSRDKNLILYEGAYEADGYLVYKNKVYELNSKNNKLTKSKLSLDKIEDRFYDIDLIKSLINYCEPEYVTNVKALCKIKYSDYLNEYNNKYGTKIESDYDNIIELYIVHYVDRIGKVIVDYTGINKIINGTDDTINYGIQIKDIDKNDFSDYLNYYKKVLSK